MSNSEKTIEGEIIDENIDTAKEIIPSMNVNLDKKNEEQNNLISDEQILGIYSEIVSIIKTDTKEISEVLGDFVNLVINEGDSSSSSKEAVVNLLKLKSDQADKLTKIADLMTRMKLKDKDTFPRYLAASQTNNINIGNSKRDILERLNKEKKIKEKDDIKK